MKHHRTPVVLGTDPAAFLRLARQVEATRIRQQEQCRRRAQEAADTLPPPEGWPTSLSVPASPALPPFAAWLVLAAAHALAWGIVLTLR